MSTSRRRRIGTGAVLGQQRVNQPSDDAASEREAEASDPRQVAVLGLTDEQQHVGHDVARGKLRDALLRGVRERRVRVARDAKQGVEQVLRRGQVTDQHQLLDAAHGQRHHLAPLVGARFDQDEIAEYLLVEPADLLVGDGGDPGGHPIRGVVANLVHLDGHDACVGQVARVLLRDVLLVGVRRQDVGCLAPQVGELRLAPERARRRLTRGQFENAVALRVVGHERLEGLREARRGRPVPRHRLGHELRHQRLVHPLAQLGGQIDAFGLAVFVHRLRFIEQRRHHLGRHPGQAAREVAQHPIELPRIGAGDEGGQRLEQLGELRLLLAEPVAFLLALFDDTVHEGRQALRFVGDCEQRREHRVVEVGLFAGEIGRQDVLPVGVLGAGAFAQHLTVVDLPDLERSAATGFPGPRDAAFVADVSGRLSDEHQEGVPRRRLELADEVQLADAVSVQHRGQFDDGLVGPRQHSPADQQRIGHHGDEERTVGHRAGAGGRDAGQRVLDGRVGRGVHRHDPRRGFAGTGQIQQLAARVGRQRLGLV